MKPKYHWYKVLLFLFDLVILNFSFAVAMRIRFAPHIDIIDWHWTNIQIIPSVSFFMLFSLLTIFIFYYYGLYKINIITRKSLQLIRIIKGLVLSAVIYMLIQFIFKTEVLFTTSRFVLLTWSFISLFLFLIFRVILYSYIHRTLIQSGITRKKLLIIGDKHLCLYTADVVRKHPECGLDLSGYFFLEDDSSQEYGTKYLGIYSYENAEKFIKKNNITHLIVAVDSLNPKNIIELIGRFTPIVPFVEVTSLIYSRLSHLLNIEWYSDIPVIPFNKSPYYRWYRFFKRFIDVLVASVTILLFSPFNLISFIINKLSSPGPFLIKQKRIGKNGKEFIFYKLRSMKPVSVKKDNKRHEKYINYINNENEIVNKVIEKDRVTGYGNFLRKTALDELPQFYNVIKGDMSLVGPRPCLPVEYESYDNWHKKRYEITPGCTGIWQVLKNKGTSFSDTILLDLYYINKVSPWLDLQLIIMTVYIMITGSADK